ncbi:hypothetical protein AAHH80_38115, partial [Burkholderia pseudomallei]
IGCCVIWVDDRGLAVTGVARMRGVLCAGLRVGRGVVVVAVVEGELSGFWRGMVVVVELVVVAVVVDVVVFVRVGLV